MLGDIPPDSYSLIRREYEAHNRLDAEFRYLPAEFRGVITPNEELLAYLAKQIGFESKETDLSERVIVNFNRKMAKALAITDDLTWRDWLATHVIAVIDVADNDYGTNTAYADSIVGIVKHNGGAIYKLQSNGTFKSQFGRVSKTEILRNISYILKRRVTPRKSQP